MSVIYNREEAPLQRKYLQTLSADAVDISKFIKNKLGIPDEQLSSIIKEFCGRDNKTPRDDIVDGLKDTICTHLNNQLYKETSTSFSAKSDYLGLRYYDSKNNKDWERESKHRYACYEKVLAETDELTNEWLNNWIDDFTSRTDCVPIIGIQPIDIIWFTHNGRSENITTKSGNITDNRIERLIEMAPEGTKAIVYVTNPAPWVLNNGSGNELFWIKAAKTADVVYVPKDAVFEKPSWLKGM